MSYNPKKQLGQNFLSDKKVLMKIVESANIKEDDIILEIGPGQGSLTYHLAQKAKKVIAVEKDQELVEYLENKFKDLNNLEIINEDILDFLNDQKIKGLNEYKYKIVGNIPYYLTSFLLRKIFEIENKPSEVIFMVQKEVGERIVSQKGNMNLLAISVQLFAKPEILFYVSKNSFWPKPKVDSVVVKFSIFNSQFSINDSISQFSKEELESFFDVVKLGFFSKRKLLANNLSKGLGISKEKIYDIFKSLGIDKNARAQDLGVEEWVSIYKKLKN